MIESCHTVLPKRLVLPIETNERHSNEGTLTRRSVLILGNRPYARLLLIIAKLLLILLVLVIRGLYESLRVRASLTLVGATLTLVLRLLQYWPLLQLLLRLQLLMWLRLRLQLLLLLLLLRVYGMRHVRLIWTVHDLVGNDIVWRLRLKFQ